MLNKFQYVSKLTGEIQYSLADVFRAIWHNFIHGKYLDLRWEKIDTTIYEYR